MLIVDEHTQARLMETVRHMQGQSETCAAIIFSFSKLGELFRSPYQLKIAVNILVDVFKTLDGAVFPLDSGDVVCVLNNADRELMQKGIFQLRYLFAEDPLSYLENGADNPNFCSVYDLGFQYPAFVASCRALIGQGDSVFESPVLMEEVVQQPSVVQDSQGLQRDTQVSFIQSVIKDLERVDLSSVLRKQPTCILGTKDDFTPIFSEVYLRLSHVARLIRLDESLLRDVAFQRILTSRLDGLVLRALTKNSSELLKEPVSLNLHISTLLGSEFEILHRVVPHAKRQSIIIEMSLSDVVERWVEAVEARELCQQLGYRVCLDGVDVQSLPYFNPKGMGFDLVKLIASPDQVRRLLTHHYPEVRHAINQSNPNRLILSRCESSSMMELGKSYGLRLFQGRYIDQLLYPHQETVN